MREFNNKQKELLRQCKFFKGESECPYKDMDYSYETLIKEPCAYWWYAEMEAVEMGMFNDIVNAIECKIYKHMEMSPLTEKEAIDSYKALSI